MNPALPWFLSVNGALAMMGAQLLFTYAPVMNNIFHSAPLDAESWLRILGVAGTTCAASNLKNGFPSPAVAASTQFLN